MDALTATVRVKRRVAGCGRLCRGHALEIKCVNGMGDVGLHNGQNLLLSLQGSNTLKGFRDHAHVKMVTRPVKVDDFHHRFWDGFQHLGFHPRCFHHGCPSMAGGGRDL